MIPAKTDIIKTRAYVVRRTNYGEADRIISLVTPLGKFSAMAKGVRRPRSKLAGGIEMFTRSEVVLHAGRGELMTLTSAKMERYMGRIAAELLKMELAGVILKRVGMAAEDSDNPEFFAILDQSLMSLDAGVETTAIEAWFWLNLAQARGEQVNLHRDSMGELLRPDARYSWNMAEDVLTMREDGVIDANAIKLMRLMLTTPLSVVSRVKGMERYMPEIVKIARAVNKT